MLLPKTPTTPKIHTTRVNLDVAFDSESKKDKGEIDSVDNTTIIQDAFISVQCWDIFVLNETLEQGIFARENTTLDFLHK